MGYYLGIDLGTSYFKAGVFDENGKLKGLGRQVVRKRTGDGTICELPISLFWTTLRKSVQEAIQNAGITSKDIITLSYSSQANSFVLLDGNMQPLTSIILWPDNRAGETGTQNWALENKDDFLKTTGIGIDTSPQFAVAKINWFQKNQPEIWKRVKTILFISDYLTYELTGKKISDVSTLSLTGLLDVKKSQWWNSALNAFYLNSGYLPSPQLTGSYVGGLTGKGAKLIGLSPNISYYLGCLDHHCAAIGTGVLLNNTVSESTGTVLACVSHSQSYAPDSGICTAQGMTDGCYFRMAFNNNGAVSLEWYRENFAKEYTIEELIEMAKDIEAGCNGLVAKPCVHNYNELSGFENIQSIHKYGHFVRAILESTANSLNSLIKELKGTHFSGRVISTGGGAKSRLWVQIKASIANVDFYIPETNEAACLGAAMIGAVGAGKLGDWSEVTKKWIQYKEMIKPVSKE